MCGIPEESDIGALCCHGKDKITSIVSLHL